MESLDVSDKTIRRLLKRGDLQQHSMQHGRILITAESVAQVAQQIDRPLNRAEDAQEPVEPSQPQPTGESTQLARSVELMTEMLRDQQSYIRQLQERIAELESYQRYGPKMDEHDRAIAELQAALAAAQTGQSPAPSLRAQTPKNRSMLQRMLRRLIK